MFGLNIQRKKQWDKEELERCSIAMHGEGCIPAIPKDE